MALVAFVAGLMISESAYDQEALAHLFPVRDSFVALFFVTMGLLVDPRALISNLPLLGVMVGLILLGKFVIWTMVVRLFGYSIWTAVVVGVGLTQIGEFSFILVQVARSSGLVGSDVYNATLAGSLVTILANAALVRYVPNWIGKARLARHDNDGWKDLLVSQGHVVDTVDLVNPNLHYREPMLLARNTGKAFVDVSPVPQNISDGVSYPRSNSVTFTVTP